MSTARSGEARMGTQAAQRTKQCSPWPPWPPIAPILPSGHHCIEPEHQAQPWSREPVRAVGLKTGMWSHALYSGCPLRRKDGCRLPTGEERWESTLLQRRQCREGPACLGCGLQCLHLACCILVITLQEHMESWLWGLASHQTLTVPACAVSSAEVWVGVRVCV